jgi:Tfp pilus assembly protein PilX
MTRQYTSDGFVSLFTAIMISMLLLVITLSLVSLESLQLRKTEDAEQTQRAYYAAEAGVEDAVAKILSGAITSATPTSCAQSTIGPASGGAMWTCQQVTFSGDPAGNLAGPPEESAATIAAGSNPGFNSIEIEWNQGSQAAPYYDAWTLVCGGSCNLPSQSGWTAGPPGPFAPPLEATVVEYPGGGISANSVCTGYSGGTWQPGGCTVKTQNALFIPGGTGGGAGFVDYSADLTNKGPFRANCAAAPRANPTGWQSSSAYNCYMVLTHLNGNNFLLRLRSRYAGSQYRVTFWSSSVGGGSQKQLAQKTATIDVTARAGDAYRRVLYQYPLGQGAASTLNYVLYSDSDVCKNFDVINNVAQAGCPY